MRAVLVGCVCVPIDMKRLPSFIKIGLMGAEIKADKA